MKKKYLKIDLDRPLHELTEEECKILTLFFTQWQNDPSKIKKSIRTGLGAPREEYLDIDTLKMEKFEHPVKKNRSSHLVTYSVFDKDTNTHYLLAFTKPIKVEPLPENPCPKTSNFERSRFIVIDDFLGRGISGSVKSSTTRYRLERGKLFREECDVVIKTMRVSEQYDEMKEDRGDEEFLDYKGYEEWKRGEYQSESAVAGVYLGPSSLYRRPPETKTKTENKIRYELIMPLAKGRLLSKLLADGTIGSWKYKKQLELIIAIAKAIDDFHKKTGCVHHDIKIDNIMVDPKTLEVTLIDYDYAAKINSEETHDAHFCYWDPRLRKESYRINESFDYFSLVMVAVQILLAAPYSMDTSSGMDRVKPFFQQLVDEEQTEISSIDYDYDFLERQLALEKKEMASRLAALTRPDGVRATGGEFIREIAGLIEKEKSVETSLIGIEQEEKSNIQFDALLVADVIDIKLVAAQEQGSKIQFIFCDIDKTVELADYLCSGGVTNESISVNKVKDLNLVSGYYALSLKQESFREFLRNKPGYNYLFTNNVFREDDAVCDLIYRRKPDYTEARCLLLQGRFANSVNNTSRVLEIVSKHKDNIIKEIAAYKALMQHWIREMVSGSEEMREVNYNILRALLGQARGEQNKRAWETIKSELVNYVRKNPAIELSNFYKVLLQMHFKGRVIEKVNENGYYGSWKCRLFGVGTTSSWDKVVQIMYMRGKRIDSESLVQDFHYSRRLGLLRRP